MRQNNMYRKNNPRAGKNKMPRGPQEQRNVQEQRHGADQPRKWEGGHNRNFRRDSQTGPAYGSPGQRQRDKARARALETVEDIRADIARIEKEIELEIKEIRGMRLGL